MATAIEYGLIAAFFAGGLFAVGSAAVDGYQNYFPDKGPSTEFCAPLAKEVGPHTYCMGDMVIMADGSVTRVGIEHQRFDNTPAEVGRLLEMGEALEVVTPANNDYFARLKAQYEQQLQLADQSE